jgi:hypothetical protein
MLPAVLACALLLASLAGSAGAWADEQEPSLADSPLFDSDDRTIAEGIARMESSQGAFAAELPEQLLSLGLTLQRQGRHGEAIRVLKRGAHLARINNGLYCTEQIPLLEGEITSHIALGEYALADERQHYLYRVQVRSLRSGRPRTLAFIQQANWQYNAYRLGLGEQDFGRLMNMWDLYRLALNDIVTREGETSPDLLPPLYGMLRAQYLISGYDGNVAASGFSGADTYIDKPDINRFNAYRAQSYKKGRAVILAIHDVEAARHGAPSVQAAEALTLLGDWLLWNEERGAALEAYRDAQAELVQLDDAQQQLVRLFSEPVALPDVDGVRPLPSPVDAADAEAGQGGVVLEFGVTPEGKVVDLQRLDHNDTDTENGRASRLMRTLRKTLFRPRFEEGEPVGTEHIVRIYDIE